MSKDFSATKAFSSAPFEAFALSAKGLQAITAEIIDYSRKSYEKSRVLLEKLIGVKKIEDAIQLQSDFAQSALEDYFAQATKIGEIYTNFARDAFKPANAAPPPQPSVITPSSIGAPSSKAPAPAKQNGSHAE